MKRPKSTGNWNILRGKRLQNLARLTGSEKRLARGHEMEFIGQLQRTGCLPDEAAEQSLHEWASAWHSP